MQEPKQEQEYEKEKIILSDGELKELKNNVEEFIQENWPPDVRYVIAPSKVDYDAASGFKEFLEWLRGDTDRVYRSEINIAKEFHTVALIPMYKAKNVEMPPEIKVLHEENQYNFYEIRVHFHSILEEHVLLKNVKLKLKVTDNSENNNRETVFTSMIPDNTYVNILKSNTKAEVAFTAEAKAKAAIPPFKLKFGEVDLNTSIVNSIDSKTELTLPEIKINKTIISAVGEHHNECTWRFDKVQSDEDIQVLVILKVPQEAKDVKVKAFLEVTPYKDEWAPLPDTRLTSIKTSLEREIDLRT